MSARFSEKAQKVILIAQEEAKRLSHDYVGTEHILLGLVSLGDGIAAQALMDLGADYKKIRHEIEKISGAGDNMMLLGEIPFTPKAKKVLEYAVEEAQIMENTYIGTEHILLGLTREEEGVASKVLLNLNLKPEVIRSAVMDRLNEEPEIRLEGPGGQHSEEREMPARPNAPAKKKKSETPNLDEFSRDLTQLAREDKLDPVIGRETEIERVIQILGRRTKNNPVLIGEPGVGKTAVAECLAQKIASGDVADALLNKRLLTLDLASVVAGTKYRGEFEQRLKSLINEIRDQQGKIIVFIDELHTVIGAGAAEGSIDAANMLKPALARGELQCIGATTFDEYRKHIEHDPALERRFQPVIIEQPTISQAIEILHGVKDHYARHHNVKYDDEAIVAAVAISERYITDRALPDKALDLLDEAGSRARLKTTSIPPTFKDKEHEIQKISEEKNAAVTDQEYEKAAKLREEEQKLRKELDKLRKHWRDEKNKEIPTVTADDIALVASKWTGIPVTKLTEKESEKLLHIEEELHKRLIGQDEAVTTIAQAIRRSRTGLKDPNKPIGGFLFLGPTGVGKTELARALASYLFGNEDAMVRIDMSEYMEKFAVSRLIGAPPGYVGYDEGGQLTEIVRRKPYSVVVLDEIEKAHPDVYNILLQVLDEGRLTDNLGHKVSFKNTIIIMTSNVGARLISKGKSLGFASKADEDRDYKQIKTTVLEEVKRIFSPEFINRIDEIIVFHPLNQQHMLEILELMLERVDQKLEESGVKLEVTDAAKIFLVEQGFDPNYGARPLLRTLQRQLEDPLAEEILSQKTTKGMVVSVDVTEGENKKLAFGIKTAKESAQPTEAEETEETADAEEAKNSKTKKSSQAKPKTDKKSKGK